MAISESDRNPFDGDRSDLVAAVLGLKADVLEDRIPLGEVGQYSTSEALVRLATPEACERLASAVREFAQAAPDRHNPAVIFLALVGDLASALSAWELWHEASLLYLGMEDGFRRHMPNSLGELMIGHAEALAGAGRSDEALSRYGQAKTILASQGKDEEVTRCRREQAIILGKLGRFREALSASQEAAALDLGIAILTDGVSEKRLSLDEAREMVQGIRLSGLASSEPYLNLGRHLREANADESAHAPSVIILATLSFTLAQAAVGKIEENACASLVAAGEAVIASHSESDLLGIMRLEWSKTLWKRGRYTEALTWCERAETILTTQGSEEDLADCLMIKAVLLDDLGQYLESIAAFEEAERILATLDRPDLLARCRLNHGGVLHHMNRNEEAVGVLLDAETAFERLGMADSAARCRTNRALALKASGWLAEALSAMIEAEAVFAAAGQLQEVSICKMHRGQILLDFGCPSEAVDCYREVDPSVLSDQTRAAYHEQLAVAAYTCGDEVSGLDEFTKFRRLSRRARYTAGIDETSLDYAGLRSGSRERAVRLALEAGQLRGAYQAVLDGKAGVFGDLRQRQSERTYSESASLVERRRDLGKWLLLNGRSKATEPELLLPETESKVRAYLEAFRATNPGSPPTRDDQEEEMDLEEIQAALPDDWGLLDFWRMDRETIQVFVLTRSDFQVRSLHVPMEEEPLRSRLVNLGRCIDAASPVGSDEALDDIHHYLLAPLQPLIGGLRGLYLVPHGKLHLLPLHACRKYVNGRFVYLGDEYEIAYLPSARLLPTLPSLDTDGGIFSLANPDLGSPQTLPFSHWEAKTIRRLFSDRPGEFHVGADASVLKTREWGLASVLHFSCHGTGDSANAAISRLYLADDVLLAHDVLYRRPRLADGSLVILNGCETGRSDYRSLEDVMGLMTTFLLRGAALVLSTAWSVDDCCAAEMVTCFLDELLRHRASPSMALRQAQARVRALRPEDLSRRERQLLQEFPRDEFPHEAASIHRRAAMRCVRSGRYVEAADHGRQAAEALRLAGDPFAAEAILAWSSTPPRMPAQKGYDHPIFWSAFQLIGRVT